MRISVNHVFERRIGLFPAGFDADGVLFCNQNFADYPMVVPDGPFDPWRDAFELPTLTAGRDYWVAVDSFGETGITEGGNPRWSLPREHGEREQAAQQLGAIPILGTAVQQSESLTSMGPRGGPSPRGGEVAVERCMQPDAAAPSHDSNPRTP